MRNTQEVSEQDIKSIEEDGIYCACVKCHCVFAKLENKGREISELLSPQSKVTADAAVRGKKGMTCSLEVRGHTHKKPETNEEGKVATKITSFYFCDDCNNTTPCEYSEYSSEKCPMMDAILLPLCISLMLPRETLDNFKREKQSLLNLLQIYKLASVIQRNL